MHSTILLFIIIYIFVNIKNESIYLKGKQFMLKIESIKTGEKI